MTLHFIVPFHDFSGVSLGAMVKANMGEKSDLLFSFCFVTQL